MLGVEDLFVAGLVWLLYKGGKAASKPGQPPLPAPPAPKGQAPTPSKAAWPVAPPPPPAPPSPAAQLTADDHAAIAQQEAQHGAEQVKFDAQLQEAKMRAGKDKHAQNDIAKKAKARQKALDDWKRDIEAAKQGA